MTRKNPAARLAALSAFSFTAVLLATTAAFAQQPSLSSSTPKVQEVSTPTAHETGSVATPAPQEHDQEKASETGEFGYERLQVGDATQSLLAWQRSGEIASAAPRTIAGSVANRSYERYLKSFEFPIPERMTSIVRQSSSSGSSGGGGAMPK